MTLEELRSERDAAYKEYEKLNEAVYWHPENVLEQLGGSTHPLAKRVTRAKRCSGWTDSSEDVVEWDGYEFVLDGLTYTAMECSGWCNFTEIVYPDGKVEKLPSWEENWSDAEDGDGFDKMLKDGHPPEKVVGLALLVLNGIVG